MMLSFRFYVSAAIFVITLFLVIRRPKNIGIGYSALIGAAASYALGLINSNSDNFRAGSARKGNVRSPCCKENPRC